MSFPKHKTELGGNLRTLLISQYLTIIDSLRILKAHSIFANPNIEEYKLFKPHLKLPFIRNHYGEENGAAEDDVVDGVEELGKKNSIQLSLLRKRPAEH